MAISDFEMETMRVVINNGDDYRFVVGPDVDGLGCVEVSYIQNAEKPVARITVPPECAELIAKAMLACAAEMRTAISADMISKII